MDQVAMISWLSKSTFRSASCPPPTIEVKKKKNLHIPFSNYLCNWVAGFVTQLSTMRFKEKVAQGTLRMLIISLIREIKEEEAHSYLYLLHVSECDLDI